MSNCNHNLVPAAWARGKRLARGNLSTDGRELYSYNLRIGYTDSEGTKVAIKHTAPDHFVSMTTSKHVGGACQYADKVVSPDDMGA